MEIKLRPHHLLCIQKFVGRGYDGGFTQNLAKIAEYLSAHPEATVTLVEGCDEVCLPCPNRVEDKCTDGEKTDALDGAVLDCCTLKYGDTDIWSHLSKRAREEVFETDEFGKICSACQWYDICKNTGD